MVQYHAIYMEYHWDMVCLALATVHVQYPHLCSCEERLGECWQSDDCSLVSRGLLVSPVLHKIHMILYLALDHWQSLVDACVTGNIVHCF